MLPIRRRPPSTSVSVLYLSYEIAVPDSEPRHILEEIVWQKEAEVGPKARSHPASRTSQKTPLCAPHPRLPRRAQKR